MDIDIGNYDPSVLKQISHLPQVRSLETYVSPNGAPVTKSGTFRDLPILQAQTEGSLNGLYFNQDKVTIIAGRMANPARADEVVVDQLAVQTSGVRLGEVIHYGFFTNAQLQTGNPTTPAYKVINLHIVGVGVWNDEVVQDDIDRIPKILMTPALTRQVVGCCITYAWSGIKLRGGASQVAAVEREYLRLLPAGDPYYFHVSSVIESEAEQAVKPESIALGVFGAIAALTALIVSGLAVSRQLQLASEDRDVMRSLGASATTTVADGLIGIMMAVVVGGLVAAGIAIVLSPITFGPLRAIEPSPGISADWAAIGFGFLALVAILWGVAFAIAVIGAPHRAGRRWLRTNARVRLPRIMSGVATLPASAATGIRFAIQSGRGRSAVPVRSVIAGVTLAVAVVAASLTFGSSLRTLISQPRLFGWNWNYFMQSNAGYGDIPQASLSRLLNKDHDVAAWTGIYFDSLLFNGRAVPVIGGRPGTSVAPPLLRGHSVDAANQVVFGPSTMSLLHTRVGGTVRVTGGGETEILHVVGEAVMPTIGIGFGLHLSPGTGAVVPYDLLPVGARNIQEEPTIGPNGVLIRFSNKVGTTAALRSVTRIMATLNAGPAGGAGIQSYRLLLPAEIINYKTMGLLPTILAAGLAAGAVFAVALTLAASVRRRRRELALFKTLGFTRRQLQLTVGWQATVTAIIGTVIGLPVGILLGRSLWELFAHELYVVPNPSVPVLDMVLVVVGALVLVNLVAAIPGGIAARTPAALVLRVD
jgi:hypothetical protein